MIPAKAIQKSISNLGCPSRGWYDQCRRKTTYSIENHFYPIADHHESVGVMVTFQIEDSLGTPHVSNQ